MRSCNDCMKKIYCKEPCSWMEKELNKVTIKRNYREIPWEPELQDQLIPQGPTLEELFSFYREDNLSFEGLSTLQNNLLKDFYFNGFSYARLASKYKIPLKKVENQLYQAKKKLKRLTRSRAL